MRKVGLGAFASVIGTGLVIGLGSAGTGPALAAGIGFGTGGGPAVAFAPAPFAAAGPRVGFVGSRSGVGRFDGSQAGRRVHRGRYGDAYGYGFGYGGFGLGAYGSGRDGWYGEPGGPWDAGPPAPPRPAGPPAVAGIRESPSQPPAIYVIDRKPAGSASRRSLRGAQADGPVRTADATPGPRVVTVPARSR